MSKKELLDLGEVFTDLYNDKREEARREQIVNGGPARVLRDIAKRDRKSRRPWPCIQRAACQEESSS